MHCLVPIKQVVDPYVHIRINADQSGIDTANVKKTINPFDEIALEEAVKLKTAGIVTLITTVSIGTSAIQESLRQALARGADKALLIETDQTFTPLSIAKILMQITKQLQPNFILMGKQAIDDDCNQTGQMLAGLLGWPQATFASHISFDQSKVEVTREVDGGLETILCNLPAVITTDLRLNEPRILSLPNVMQAKRKPLDTIALQKLNLNLPQCIKTLKVTPPSLRKPGVKVDSADELIDKLINEAKVL